MNNTLCLIACTLFFYALPVDAARKTTLIEIEPIKVVGVKSENEVRSALIKALLDKDWVPRAVDHSEDQQLFAIFNIYSHSLKVKIRYDTTIISLSYEDSKNLNYLEKDGHRFIHPAYFEWTAWLIEEIKANLESGDSVLGFSNDCYKKLLSRKNILPNNDFKLSRGRLAVKICSEPPIKIVVSDQRPYVLSGKKKRSFSGLKRTVYGIPLSLNAKKNVSTTESVAEGIRLVLERSIPNASGFGILDNTTFEQVTRKQAIVEKQIQVELREWKFDRPRKGMGKSAFYYDLEVKVQAENNGDVLAVSSIKGTRIVKSNQLVKSDHAWIYEQIFNSEEIRRAVSDTKPFVTVKIEKVQSPSYEESSFQRQKNSLVNEGIADESKCSVNQVLKMNDIGLNKAQIEAACDN
jgi:hypothetical protein